MKFTGIVGVIIITILVIIIASLTYIRVESLREEQMRIHNQYIEGVVVTINQTGSVEYNDDTYKIWSVTLSNNSIENTYLMIFDETYPPHSNIFLRFYYDTFIQEENTYYVISSVKEQ